LKDSQAEARTYAIRLIGYRSRSRKEMRQRLRQKGFSDAHAENTIRFLERSGLMNDEVLASELFRYSTERKSLGRNGVRMFLSKRGIEKPLIDKVLQDHSDDMENKSAREFVNRKLRTMKNSPEDVVRRRLGGMLQRRGFSTEIIYKVIHSIKL
jgi:regulatory protein